MPLGGVWRGGRPFGLGLEGGMKTSINLLPTSSRRQQVLRRCAIQWGSLVSLVLLSGWGWHWYELGEDRSFKQQLEVLEREHAPTQRLLQQLVDMRVKLEQLHQQEVVAGELERQRSALTLLGVVSQTARQTDGRLRLTKLVLTNFQASVPGDSAAAAGGGSELLLGGISLDNPAVGELLDGLQDSGIFNRVELLVLKERQGSDLSLRDYEVQCEF
jgi:Tfp pilus assembly protein PilN